MSRTDDIINIADIVCPLGDGRGLAAHRRSRMRGLGIADAIKGNSIGSDCAPAGVRVHTETTEVVEMVREDRPSGLLQGRGSSSGCPRLDRENLARYHQEIADGVDYRSPDHRRSGDL
jgi:hypothetical protein